MSAHLISVVSSSADTQLCICLPSFCLVAPPPLKTDFEALLSTLNVVGMFRSDHGVDWPDYDECRWTSEYPPTRRAIVLQFDKLKDALVVQKHLTMSVAASMTVKKASPGRKRAITLSKPDRYVTRTSRIDGADIGHVAGRHRDREVAGVPIEGKA